MAARHHVLPEGRHDPQGILLVHDEVEHPDHEHAHRLVEVDQPGDVRVGQDLGRTAQVGLDGGDAGGVGQQHLGVPADHGVVVHVDHPAGGVHRADGLVDAGRGGDAGAEIDELPDAPLGQMTDRLDLEPAVGPGHEAGVGGDREQLLGHGAVDRQVVLASEEVVVHPGRTRYPRVDAGRNAF